MIAPFSRRLLLEPLTAEAARLGEPFGARTAKSEPLRAVSLESRTIRRPHLSTETGALHRAAEEAAAMFWSALESLLLGVMTEPEAYHLCSIRSCMSARASRVLAAGLVTLLRRAF